MMKETWRRLGIGLSSLLIGLQTSVYAEEVVEQLAEADNKFGKVIMAELIKSGENVFISPYSITTALSMLGHCAETGEQIEELWELLGYGEITEEEILQGQQELMKKLRPDYGMEDYTDEEREWAGIGTVEIANAFYVDDEVNAVPEFEQLTMMLEGYQAELAVKELETEKTMDEINSWVNEKTHELIPSLLDEPLSEDIMLMLMNTVYFKNQWARVFMEEQTTQERFYGTNEETEVSMMHQQGRFLYTETDDYQVIRLRYSGNAYEMCIWLPKDAELCEKWNDAEYLTKLNELDMGDEYREVLLSMPKFELEYSVELSDILKEIGMEKIFEENIYDRLSYDGLGVGSILHKTALKNDENGTEAAAVTAILVTTMSFIEPEEPVEMTIDRPFYFTITHTELGLNLFEGCVLNLGE